jgi:transcriptional regulator with XRE-family HTH domain
MAGKLGEFLRERRTRLNLGLREFCETARLDPSNYSKIERGTLVPPQEKLDGIARGLRIKKGTRDWDTLQALAAGERGEVPSEWENDERVKDLLPALYLKLRGYDTEEKDPISELVKLLRRAV